VSFGSKREVAPCGHFLAGGTSRFLQCEVGLQMNLLKARPPDPQSGASARGGWAVNATSRIRPDSCNEGGAPLVRLLARRLAY
jgi:hypothetical protein